MPGPEPFARPSPPSNISRFPVHLGLGATATREPEHKGDMEWYAAYATRHASDGSEGRLVSLHTFREPWTVWEMHPKGDELLVCISGRVVVHQELGGEISTTTLTANQALVNPPDVWHTADAEEPTTMLFITAGESTEHRFR